MKETTYAALYFDIEWKYSKDTVSVSKGIVMGKCAASSIRDLYEKVCEKYRADDGEPYGYDVYALFKETEDDENIYFSFDSDDSIIDQFSNVLVFTLKRPIIMCRLMWSDDNFATISGTKLIHYSTEAISNLFGDNVKITDIEVECILTSWRKTKAIYKKLTYDNRLIEVLDYYYIAWRSHTCEQLVINMAIILELLFAPHSHSEINHQIAFNVSRYLGEDFDSRQSIYKRIKNFYSIRSAIIHGGIPEFKKVYPVAKDIFCLVTDILNSIISNEDMTRIFSNDKDRKELLDSYIFS